MRRAREAQADQSIARVRSREGFWDGRQACIDSMAAAAAAAALGAGRIQPAGKDFIVVIFATMCSIVAQCLWHCIQYTNIWFTLYNIVYCHCIILCIVIVHHCVLSLYIIVYCIILCIVIVYHCVLLLYIIVYCHCIVLCIVIVWYCVLYSIVYCHCIVLCIVIVMLQYEYNIVTALVLRWLENVSPQALHLYPSSSTDM